MLHFAAAVVGSERAVATAASCSGAATTNSARATRIVRRVGRGWGMGPVLLQGRPIDRRVHGAYNLFPMFIGKNGYDPNRIPTSVGHAAQSPGCH